VLRTHSFSVGDFQIARSSGTPVLAFGWPVFNDKGALVRVLFASLKLSLLSESIAEKEVPPGSLVAILDSHGTVLAAYPQPERWVGKPFPSKTVTERVVGDRRASFELTGDDGTPTLYAAKPVYAEHVSALHVFVATPLSASLAAANSVLLHNIAILLLVSVLVWFSL